MQRGAGSLLQELKKKGMTDMKTCIAVDIGGTKMLIAEVREDGTIINIKRYPTGKACKEEIIRILIQGVLEYENEIGWESGSRPHQMGIGINGLIDPVQGIWKRLESEESEIALIERIEQEFEVECHIDNDVKATVIAENKFGAGKNCRDMIYINIGTGLAAGIIANGRLIRGTDGFAGEIGYMNFTGGEGSRVELMASGMGINHQIELLINEYPNSVLKEKAGGVVSGQEVFQAAERGDELANHVLDRLVKMSGLMISNLTCVLSPEIVILGGGLITNGCLMDKMIDAVTPKAAQHLEKGIVLTGLDPAYAGLMGAAAIGLGYQREYL